MNAIIFYSVLVGVIGVAIDYFARKENSIVVNVTHSFHNRPEGFSARKLAAFTGVMVAIWITIKYTTTETLEGTLLLWLGFSLLCLGIITFEQIIRFKGGASPQPEQPKQTPQS